MEKKEKRLSDEEMSNQVVTIIDEVVKNGKKAVRSLFNLMIERTAQTAEDLVDKGIDDIKQKINERESDGRDKEQKV
jgi:predicted transcriptional regulator YheO